MKDSNKRAVKVTENGVDSLCQLTEIRRVFEDVAVRGFVWKGAVRHDTRSFYQNHGAV